MLRTIHEQSVSYSVALPNPPAGEGKHAKSDAQKRRRHAINRVIHGVPVGMRSAFRVVFLNELNKRKH